MNYADSHLLDQMALVAAGFAETRDFRPLGPFAERHGSWEITFCRRGSQAADLDRFVCLALTKRRGSYDVEFWIGAQNGDRYVRQEASGFSASEVEFRDEAFRNTLGQNLQSAIDAANDLELSGLTGTYLPSRERAGLSA